MAQSARVTQGPPTGSFDQQPPSEGGRTQVPLLPPPELEPLELEAALPELLPVVPLLLPPTLVLVGLPLLVLLLVPLLPPPVEVAPLCAALVMLLPFSPVLP
jgi:hypothetical protein